LKIRRLFFVTFIILVSFAFQTAYSQKAGNAKPAWHACMPVMQAPHNARYRPFDKRRAAGLERLDLHLVRPQDLPGDRQADARDSLEEMRAPKKDPSEKLVSVL
jgi:hypothetical protein